MLRLRITLELASRNSEHPGRQPIHPRRLSNRKGISPRSIPKPTTPTNPPPPILPHYVLHQTKHWTQIFGRPVGLPEGGLDSPQRSPQTIWTRRTNPCFNKPAVKTTWLQRPNHPQARPSLPSHPSTSKQTKYYQKTNYQQITKGDNWYDTARRESTYSEITTPCGTGIIPSITRRSTQ